MKLNYKNIALFIVLLFLIGLVIADLITISTSLAQYTWFGLTTTFFTIWGIAKIIDYFERYLEKKEVSAGNRYNKNN